MKKSYFILYMNCQEQSIEHLKKEIETLAYTIMFMMDSNYYRVENINEINRLISVRSKLIKQYCKAVKNKIV